MESAKNFVIASLEFDHDTSSVIIPRADNTVIQPKVFKVMAYLAHRYPELVTREELIENVWNGNEFVGEKALTNAVWALRQVFKDAGIEQEVIKTIRSSGYKLTMEPIDKDFVQNSVIKEVKRSWNPKVAAAGLAIFAALLFVWMILSPSNDAPPVEIVEQPVTTTPGTEKYSTPSADDKYLAYVWRSNSGRTNLYLKDMTQPDLSSKQLTFTNFYEGRPVWGRKSQYLYFSRKNARKTDCKIIQLHVSTLQEVEVGNCQKGRGIVHLDISPDGNTLSYRGKEQEDETDGIYFLDLRDSNKSGKRFSCRSNCGYIERDAAFSPDGQYLAVTRRFSSLNEDVFLIDLTNKKETRLTDGERDIEGLAWHPNGKILVFGRKHADINDGVILDLETGKRTILNQDGFRFPRFSETNSSVLYFEQASLHYDISHIPLADDQLQAVFPILESDFLYKYPMYSQARNKMAFTSNQSKSYEIWTSNVDGSDAKKLTNLDRDISHPVWSHDGKYIAFLAKAGGYVGNEVSVLEVDTGKVMVLATGVKNHRRPSWRADNKRLLLPLEQDGLYNLFEYELDSGDMQQVTKAGGSFGRYYGDNQILYVSPKTRGLWQLDLTQDNSQPELIVDKKAFTTMYSWDLHQDKLFYKTSKGLLWQFMQLDMTAKASKTLYHIPKKQMRSAGIVSYYPKGNSLLITGTKNPQSDIKMLNHPLLAASN